MTVIYISYITYKHRNDHCNFDTIGIGFAMSIETHAKLRKFGACFI